MYGMNAKGWRNDVILGLGVLLIAAACAPSHAGRTVGRGMLQLEGGLGGPLVTNLGPAIPIPNVPVGLRYGLTDRLDVAGHVNLLPLVTGGFLLVDTSLTWALVRHDGPRGWNLATSAGLAVMTDFQDEARVAPIMDIAGGYTVDWFTFYAGAEIALDPWGGGAMANPFIGAEADIRERWSLSAAFVWFSPGYSVFSSSIDYVSANSQGAVGFILGLKRRWDLSHLRSPRRAGGTR